MKWVSKTPASSPRRALGDVWCCQVRGRLVCLKLVEGFRERGTVAGRAAEIPPAATHKALQGCRQCEDGGDTTMGGQVCRHLG